VSQKLNNRSTLLWFAPLCILKYVPNGDTKYFLFFLARISRPDWQAVGGDPRSGPIVEGRQELHHHHATGFETQDLLSPRGPEGAIAVGHNPRGNLNCFQLWHYIIPYSLPHCSHSSQLSPTLDLQIHPICFAKMFPMLFSIVPMCCSCYTQYTHILSHIPWPKS
jgi:hypothetical protein